MTLFLCGDVMTGRGIDQVLEHPGDPSLREPYVRDAREYVWLAEEQNGPIPHPVSGAYLWGEALVELDRVRPDARIVNLETSVTRSDDFWPGKGIHYRMHPKNVGCLAVALLDVCVLANNHVLDFGRRGLLETLETLAAAGIQTCGAGRTSDEARRPAHVERPGRALRVFGLAHHSSGVMPDWNALSDRPGVAWVGDLTEVAAADVAERVRGAKRPGDVAVVSIHWGTNWGYHVEPEQVRFAHWLVEGGADVVHGHSSHHVRPVEVYRDRLILYGCGDFIDDYEGIAGYEELRSDLRLMYFATVDERGHLTRLRMVPLQAKRFSLVRATAEDEAWLASTLSAVGRPFGTSVRAGGDGLELAWR